MIDGRTGERIRDPRLDLEPVPEWRQNLGFFFYIAGPAIVGGIGAFTVGGIIATKLSKRKRGKR